ncbi:unnamed protein product [Oppiella nova]|uniref:NR LBD domain-containing protein n=1 Tax=Oppiella nova TaxID=334625 RepID=A0A7R9LE97_9ACAR|nr:unnamed protein product [Oppiella nova]CAG2162073.1 unnamed protein product [Oppiella nova]
MKNTEIITRSSESSSSSDKFMDSVVVSDIYENNKTVLRNVLALNQSIKSNFKHKNPMNTSVTQELTQYLSTPILRPINTYKDLNEIECKHLLDLYLASKVFHFPKTNMKYIHITNIIEFYINWCNRIEMDTQCIVSLAKELTSNVDICLNDQIALVKYGSMEISVLRANYNYDLQTENWTIYLNNDNSCISSVHILKDEKRNLYGVYKSHFNKIIPEWNWDRVLVDLLTVIILFNPNRPSIINKDKIKYQQQLYIYLLQRIEILNGVEDYIEYFGPVSQEMFRDIYKD